MALPGGLLHCTNSPAMKGKRTRDGLRHRRSVTPLSERAQERQVRPLVVGSLYLEGGMLRAHAEGTERHSGQ